MSSLGRTLLTQTLNNLLTLIVIVAIISALFVAYNQKALEGAVVEAVQMYARELAKNPKLSEEEKQRLIKQRELDLRYRFGLLGNPIEKVFNMMVRLLTLDLGAARSIYIGSSYLIKDQVIFALRNTAILFLTSTIIVAVLGIVVGLYAARKAGRSLDRLLSILAVFSASLPMWWVGMLMLLLFSFKLHLFPFQSKDVFIQLMQLERQYQTGELSLLLYSVLKLKTGLYYMALPLATVTLVSFGGWAYIVRNVVITRMSDDFVMVARAKGVPERNVLFGHVLRSASPPLVTMIVLSLVNSLGGAIITETVFGWPGMGLLYWQAILNSEPLLLGATTYVIILMFVIAVIILNFIYALLDPRVRTGGTAQAGVPRA
uniref:ABC transporter permease n=1 Tax=Fervidicoccus fontis TaxID=683846 RepID=A0A7J3ZIW1_9CREN